MQTVYIVSRQTGDGDGLYAFSDEAQAEAYARLFEGAELLPSIPLNTKADGVAMILAEHESESERRLELAQDGREDAGAEAETC